MGVDTTTGSTVPSDGGSDTESLRDALDAAFEQHESAPEGERGPASTPALEPTAPETPSDTRARDEQGRFTSKAPARAPDSPVAPQTPPAPVQATPPAQAPDSAPEKAPGSWRPEVREKWGTVDPLVRSEVVRREREFQAHLQQSAGHRQFTEAFEQLVRPYEMFMRQENATPLQAVENLLRTAADLRVGTAHTKAHLVAGIIKNFGIDLPMLDGILAGQAPDAQGAAPPQVLHDPRVDQLLAAQAHAQQQHQAYEQQQINSELENFAATHEFYDDVRNEMADLIEMAAKQGKVLAVEDAYSRACKLNDGISKIVADRAAAASAAPLTQAALRARRAAQSLKGDSTPDGATVPRDDSIRASIEAAFDAAGRT